MLRRFLAWWWSELAGMMPRRRLARVPAHLAMQRTLELPLATERNLRAVLAFEMDRYTPFKADAVYYGYSVTARDPARRLLRVLLTAVPRAAVDPPRAAVEALGVRLTLHGAPERRGLGRAGVLAAAALGLLVTALALPVARKMEEAAALQERIGAVRQQARAAEAARHELEGLLAEARALPERRRRRPPVIDVLRELTVVFPDHSWLSHLELAGSRVRVRGESRNASELVAAIERSALLSDASFDGSVTRSPGADRERFSLSAATRPDL